MYITASMCSPTVTPQEPSKAGSPHPRAIYWLSNCGSPQLPVLLHVVIEDVGYFGRLGCVRLGIPHH